MCRSLDKRPVEYLINGIDIGSDLFFAYWIYDKCYGWSIGIVICTILAIFGIILKIIAQWHKKETINPITKIKELEWTNLPQHIPNNNEEEEDDDLVYNQCETPFIFAILFEQIFEGLFVGCIEAIIIGEAMDYVGITVIIIKGIYFIYMNFKYCSLSFQDHFKPWLITLTLTMSLIWFGCTVSTLFDIVYNTPIAQCVQPVIK